MPKPTSSSVRKPASAKLATRATFVHRTKCCSLIVPPQLAQVCRALYDRLASYDVAQFGQKIAVLSRELFIPDRLEYVANPERCDVIDYAGCAAQRPALL